MALARSSEGIAQPWNKCASLVFPERYPGRLLTAAEIEPCLGAIRRLSAWQPAFLPGFDLAILHTLLGASTPAARGAGPHRHPDQRD